MPHKDTKKLMLRTTLVGVLCVISGSILSSPAPEVKVRNMRTYFCIALSCMCALGQMLRQGGQNYEIIGWKKEEVIHDVLDQYYRHMQFLDAVR